jgi:hypothetical protein
VDEKREFVIMMFDIRSDDPKGRPTEVPHLVVNNHTIDVLSNNKPTTVIVDRKSAIYADGSGGPSIIDLHHPDSLEKIHGLVKKEAPPRTKWPDER